MKYQELVGTEPGEKSHRNGTSKGQQRQTKHSDTRKNHAIDAQPSSSGTTKRVKTSIEAKGKSDKRGSSVPTANEPSHKQQDII